MSVEAGNTKSQFINLHNQDEAATLRCTPFSQAYLSTPYDLKNAAAAAGLPVSIHCIGCECMQWRKVKTVEGVKGFCGLAGVPPEVQVSVLHSAANERREIPPELLAIIERELNGQCSN